MDFESIWKPTFMPYHNLYAVEELTTEFEKIMKERIMNMGYTFNFTDGSTSICNTVSNTKCAPTMKKVIFFDRTCRVFWSDGVESEAICMKGDTYTREGILGIAIAKRFLGGYSPMNKVLEEMIESNGNLVYIELTPAQKAEIKEKEQLAIKKEKRIAAEKERQEINARRREKRNKKAEEEYANWVAKNAEKKAK